MNNPKKISLNILPFLLSVTFLFGIALGFVGLYLVNSLNKPNQNNNVISEPAQNTKVPNNTYNYDYSNLDSLFDTAFIENLFKVVKENYINDLPPRAEITDGVAKGLISALGDEYANYLNEDETKIYNESRNPDFEGIGIQLRFNGDYTEIESVISGNPAEKAGLLAGDIIIRVNDENMVGKMPQFVSSKIRGPKDTVVNLEIVRDQKQMKFSITRAKISIDNVTYKNLGNGIFRININQFVDINPYAFNESWDKVVDKVKSESRADIKGIVVDLRNNPGGFVFSVRYVLDDFIQKGKVILIEESRSSSRMEFKTNRDGAFEKVPLVVLINEGSASASEIFALAIRDTQRGKLIGKSTVGKGVEQQIFNKFTNGSSLILPFQKWLSPKGVNVTKEEPIKPDVEVDLDLDKFQKEKIDNQLNEALKYL